MLDCGYYFGEFTFRSTLAIWGYDTPYKVGIPPRPLHLLAAPLPVLAAKCPLQKSGLLVRAAFQKKCPEGRSQKPYITMVLRGTIGT